MKPWKFALALSCAWFAAAILGAIVHTELLVDGITPEQEATISRAWGQAAGMGALVLGALGWAIRARRSSR